VASDRGDEVLSLGVEALLERTGWQPVAMRNAPLCELFVDGLPLPELGIDQPIDQFAHLALEALRSVADDLRFEFPRDARLVEQVRHPADPQGLVEVVVAAALHLDQDLLDVGQR